MKIRKKICIVCIIIFILVLLAIIYMRGIVKEAVFFWRDYIVYINSDIEHQAKLFEGILGGICSGSITFGALYISLSHENKKNQMYWERERIKEKEDRLLAIRPFLNIEVKSVSTARLAKIEGEENIVSVGPEINYQYAVIILSNNGYGKCKDIELEGHKCSVRQLDIDDKKELKVFFQGISDEENEFDMYFSYNDIFGNTYSQYFKCNLLSSKKELKIEIGESLLNMGDE